MAGGLARVAAGHVVSSALGAAAKDVWVLSTQPDAPLEPWVPSDESAAGEVPALRRPATGISPRTAENLYWMGRYAERAEDASRDAARRSSTAGTTSTSARRPRAGGRSTSSSRR